MNNGRWWESYLVRYFSGFVAAIFFSLFLLRVGAQHAELLGGVFAKDLFQSANTFSTKWLWIILPVALGMCYVSSAPITVLHMGRYRAGPLESFSRYFWFGWMALGVVLFLKRNSLTDDARVLNLVGVILFIIFGSLLIVCKKSFLPYAVNFFIKTSFLFSVLLIVVNFINGLFLPIFLDVLKKREVGAWIYLAMPCAWILLGQYSVLWRLMRDEEGLYEFYGKLSKWRRQEGSVDVRESYTHLREHSNAIFIVVVELSLFSLLIAMVEIGFSRLKGDIFGIHVYQIFLFFLFIWLLPTVFMWSVANRMEKRFSQEGD